MYTNHFRINDVEKFKEILDVFSKHYTLTEDKRNIGYYTLYLNFDFEEQVDLIDQDNVKKLNKIIRDIKEKNKSSKQSQSFGFDINVVYFVQQELSSYIQFMILYGIIPKDQKIIMFFEYDSYSRILVISRSNVVGYNIMDIVDSIEFQDSVNSII